MTQYALYLDDAGHPSDQPYLVVAGYVAKESQWQAFESEWRKTLSKFGLSDPFHMTDFMGQRRQYSELKRDQILLTLAKVTNHHTIRPFVSAVDMNAWKLVNEEFALEECHGAPYAITARSLATELRNWTASNLQSEDKLLTFVEQGTLHFGDLEQVFIRDSIPVPTRVEKSLSAVQPCDILAWEGFNYLRSGSPIRPGKNLKRLLRAMWNVQDFGGIFYESDLRQLCAKTKVIPRATLKPIDTISFHSSKKRIRKRTILK
jgi:hypothetical protein